MDLLKFRGTFCFLMLAGALVWGDSEASSSKETQKPGFQNRYQRPKNDVQITMKEKYEEMINRMKEQQQPQPKSDFLNIIKRKDEDIDEYSEDSDFGIVHEYDTYDPMTNDKQTFEALFSDKPNDAEEQASLFLEDVNGTIVISESFYGKLDESDRIQSKIFVLMPSAGPPYITLKLEAEKQSPGNGSEIHKAGKMEDIFKSLLKYNVDEDGKISKQKSHDILATILNILENENTSISQMSSKNTTNDSDDELTITLESSSGNDVDDDKYGPMAFNINVEKQPVPVTYHLTSKIFPDKESLERDTKKSILDQKERDRIFKQYILSIH